MVAKTGVQATGKGFRPLQKLGREGLCVRYLIGPTAYLALVFSLCGMGSAPAATILAPGVYDLGSVTYQFDSTSCSYIAQPYGGATNTSSDGYLYFPGMGMAGARLEFPIWMWPKANGPSAAPYAPGIITLHLPTAPAENLSKWTGRSMMSYEPVLGIPGYNQKPFEPQAWTFAFLLSNISSQTAAGELTIALANGCTFHLGNTPGQPISPTLFRRIGNY